MRTATIEPETKHAEPSVVHGSFTLERRYPHAPAAVFAAWASRDQKAAWFGSGPDFFTRVDKYELDFRVGGHEHIEGPLASGRQFVYEFVYADIVDDRRIVGTYDLTVAGHRIAVTLLTVEFEPDGTGTHLLLTEQTAFLDGLDSIDDRRPGVDDMLSKLDRYMATMVVAQE
jgi:uncharacterized protein YndB with AHSA1/START domain